MLGMVKEGENQVVRNFSSTPKDINVAKLALII